MNLRKINFYLLVLAMIATIGVISYLSRTWELNFVEWLNYVFHYIWALIPFFLLFALNYRKKSNFLQTRVIFIFTLVQIVSALIGYSLAISAGLHPKLSVLLTILPLYQLILSIFAFPLYALAAKPHN